MASDPKGGDAKPASGTPASKEAAPKAQATTSGPKATAAPKYVTNAEKRPGAKRRGG